VGTLACVEGLSVLRLSAESLMQKQRCSIHVQTGHVWIVQLLSWGGISDGLHAILAVDSGQSCAASLLLPRCDTVWTGL
jgi:hypothetical protein